MDPDAGGEEDLDLKLSLQPSSLAPEPEPEPEPERPGYFICSYCGKKFSSPQAFGGHQSAHKAERSVTKRALELAAAARRDYDGQGGERCRRSAGDEQAKNGSVGTAETSTGSPHQIKTSSPEARQDIAEDMDLSLKL